MSSKKKMSRFISTSVFIFFVTRELYFFLQKTRFWVKRRRWPKNWFPKREKKWTVLFFYSRLFLSISMVRRLFSFSMSKVWVPASDLPLILLKSNEVAIIRFDDTTKLDRFGEAKTIFINLPLAFRCRNTFNVNYYFSLVYLLGKNVSNAVQLFRVTWVNPTPCIKCLSFLVSFDWHQGKVKACPEKLSGAGDAKSESYSRKWSISLSMPIL